MTGAGLPHSETPGSKRACRSPGLIAADRVLHRLVMPRHPSCARIRLAEDRNPRHSRYVATLLDTQTVQLSKIDPPPGGGKFRPAAPCRECSAGSWWACLESNQGPRPYQGRALTN